MVKIGLILAATAAALALVAPVLAQGLATQGAGSGLAGQMGGSNMCSYTNPFGLVPKFTPDFWRQMSTTRLPAGTVLTGILDDTLSSTSSKTGEIFSIRLQDGFEIDGKEVIPKQSKIIGSVVAAKSARLSKTGMPGSLDISLQTLVFPDGRTAPFYGFIEHNPGTDMKCKPGSEPVGVTDVAKKGLSGLLTLATGRVGMPLRLPTFGRELKIDRGEAVPIRLSRSLDLSRMNGAPQTVQSPQSPPTGTMQPDPVSLMQPSSNSVPGLQAPPALSLNGAAAPPVAPQRAPSAPLFGGADPNSVFNAPLHQPQPQADLPDPF